MKATTRIECNTTIEQLVNELNEQMLQFKQKMRLIELVKQQPIDKKNDLLLYQTDKQFYTVQLASYSFGDFYILYQGRELFDNAKLNHFARSRLLQRQ